MDYSEKVEAYYAEEHHFKKGIGILRELALKADVEETFKWQAPVYRVDGKNVFWIARFKNHFGIGFFNGVFLADPINVLVNVQKEKTMAMRHWHFKSADEIDEKGVLAYIRESLDNQRKGLVLASARKKEKVRIHELLQKTLNTNSEAIKAFKSLSPYKREEYAEYIFEAKQEKTKLSRLEKIIPMILAGKGLNDKYR